MNAHEKGIEAAVYAFYGTDRAKPSEGNKRDMEDALRAYLEASGLVLCEAEPKAFLVSDFADGAYLTRSMTAAERSGHQFTPLHPAFPQPLQAKEGEGA